MGLLVECPKCGHRNSMKTDDCKKCGRNVKKASGKTYWIEYYFEGGRKRERVGPSKAAAEQRLRDVLKALTEERYIEKDKAARIALGELCSWYEKLPEVKAKRSFDRDLLSIANLKRHLGEATKIKDITPGRIESFQRDRLAEGSTVYPGRKIAPATVNREVACLKTMINRAVRHGKLQHNPISQVKKLQETMSECAFSSLKSSKDSWRHVRTISNLSSLWPITPA
jgi:hypothetical protein